MPPEEDRQEPPGHAARQVHLLQDLKGLDEFEPGTQEWASQMRAC
jgi:hypothetical protein